jgi:LysR family transcriptional activator of nhaA
MVPLNFNQLYYFWVIAKAGSITAATQPLLLNQSTLSQELKQLETSLSLRLLYRSRRGVTLTEEGKDVFEYCERIFTQAEELASKCRREQVAREEFLRLGFCRSISRDKVLGVGRAIKLLDGKMIVKISADSAERLADKLLRRVCDVVLSNVDLSPALGPEFRARLIASIPHYFVAIPSLKKPGQPFPKMLDTTPLLVRSAESPIHQEGMDYLRRNGVLPNIHAELEDPDMILAMVLRGEGVGFLDPFTIQRYLERGRLVKLHERSIGVREELWLIAGRRPHPRVRVQKVLDDLMGRFQLDWKTLRGGA